MKLRRLLRAFVRSSLAAIVMVGALVAHAAANGETQREIHGRVVAVDAGNGTLVVAREFRGKTTRVTLKAGSGIRVFTCDETRASLDGVRKGARVSAFYEVVGADGVVNLIVIEPGP